MHVVGLDGRVVPWKLGGRKVLGDDAAPRSRLHLRARTVIREAFPMDQVLEEVPIPGSRLRADFLVPARSIMVEVQGEQHYRRVGRFHATRADFLRQQGRDALKAEFCRLNDITLILLRYDETDEQWRNAISGEG